MSELNFNLSPGQEQELKNYDFSQLEALSQAAAAEVANAKNIQDLKSAICKVWSKIPAWLIRILESLPKIGAFFKAIATVLDALCKP